MNNKVTLIIDGRKVVAEKGARLSDILQSEGYRFSMPCGGRGICRKCKVFADGEEVLACRYVVSQDASIELPSVSHKAYGQSESKPRGECRIAVDAGTTTVEAVVLDGDDKIVGRIRFQNPQSVYGADVINRIDYCKKHGARALQKILVEELNVQLNKLLSEESQVTRIDFAGNTVMTHLLLGEDCAAMGEYPYTPSFLKSVTLDARELGLPFNCKANTLPCISAFVGGDTVAGLLTLSEPSEGKYSLYVDLGTNAEIVLFDAKSYTATSAPAGPCMEGANISCGMSAINGAITHFAYPDKITFIGDAPQGVCGSGLIDAVGQLYKAGVIDDGGDMKEDYNLADGVILKREDIRQYQLAKSAIRAATEQLLEYRGVAKQDVQTVYLAGGFSAHTDVDNAVATGLIPRELRDKCIAVGNRSLVGCALYRDNEKTAEKISADTEFLELNDSEDFADKFVKYMSFNV